MHRPPRSSLPCKPPGAALFCGEALSSRSCIQLLGPVQSFASMWLCAMIGGAEGCPWIFTLGQNTKHATTPTPNLAQVPADIFHLAKRKPLRTLDLAYNQVCMWEPEIVPYAAAA